MEQQHKKPAANTAASFPASASSGSSSSSRSIQGSMSSAFLGVSPSMHPQRRSSPSLYPAPAPLPRHLAFRGGSAASGGSASGSSSSQFNQISPSPVASPYRRRPRPSIQRTHSLPTPFLSELSSIRRMGTNLFGDLDAQEMTQRPLLPGQHEQEMTRSSLLTMPRRHTPIPSGEFSGFPSSSQQQQDVTMQQQQQSQPSFSSLQPLPGDNSGFPFPASQQQQPQPSSFSSLQPLPGGNFSGFPSPASQQQQTQPSSSPGGNFSGFEPPVASQHLSTYLAPIPSWSTIFQSSSCSSDLPSRNGIGDAMAIHGHAQPSSDTELTPLLPPSLQIRQYDLPPLGQLTQNNGSSTESSSSTGFLQHSSDSETYELAPLPESLQMPPSLLHQVKQEPVAIAPCLDPHIISLDDDDELSDLVHSSFGSYHGHDGSASLLPMPRQPTNIEHSQQLWGSGSCGLMSMMGALQGGGQTWEAMPVPTSVHDTAVDNGGGSSSSTIPWNGHGTMPMMYSQSQQQALQQLSDLLSLWSSTENSSSDQSTGSSVAGSCQGWAAMPALVNKFDMMSIGGCQGSAGTSMSSSRQEGWLDMPAAASACNYVPKLILGGMDKPRLPPRSPALGAGTSSSMFRRGGTFFSEAEMEKIHKDNRLKELIKIDPKRVKRILNNRVSAAKMKVQEANYIQNLQSRADALKMECSSLSTQVQSQQEMLINLKTENHQMLIKLKGLKEQDNLSQALNNQLASEVQMLKLLGLSMLCANGIHHPNSSQMAGGNSSSANDLHQLMNSDANGLIGSHQLQTHEHTPQLQLEQQAHQAVDDEIMGQPQQP